MPPLKFKSKKRNRKQEAMDRLKAYWEKDHPDEEWEPESEPVITPLLKAVEGGIPRVIEALRAHDDSDAESFIEVFDSLSETDKALVPIEAVSFAASIGSLRLAEVAQTALFLHGQMRTKFLLATGIPAIVEKSIKIAKTVKGLADREMMLKAGGVLPVPKGAQIAIQNNYGAEKEEKSSNTPAWKDSGDRLREFHDLTEPKRLPSPSSPPISIGGHIDHMQAETVEILRGDDGRG